MRRLGLVAALGLVACAGGESDGAGPRGPRARGADRVGGEVVATVDGHPIRRADVEHAARTAGVPPRVALERLIDETLLTLAAEREAGGRDAEADGAARQALVQALLARSVEAIPVEIDPAALEEAYDANRGRFDAPERRRSAHVLARVPEGADDADAAAWIAEVHRELREAADPLAALLAVRRRPLEALGFEVLVQEIAALGRDAETDAAYLDALFARESSGLVPAPVRTSMGWHAILVTGIEPARTTTREEALETLRGEREAEVRYGALARLLAEIAARTTVYVDPEIGVLLAHPALDGPAP